MHRWTVAPFAEHDEQGRFTAWALDLVFFTEDPVELVTPYWVSFQRQERLKAIAERHRVGWRGERLNHETAQGHQRLRVSITGRLGQIEGDATGEKEGVAAVCGIESSGNVGEQW
jgi:hypothetical protein